MPQASRPISSHPGFRIVVAVWFAALLGLGTFVLPAGVFESAVVATGLDRVVPAAAPPLGSTARLAISIAAALIGLLLGLFVASRARRAEVTGPAHDGDRLETAAAQPDIEDTPPAPARRRPLSVREELAEDFPPAPPAEMEEDPESREEFGESPQSWEFVPNTAATIDDDSSEDYEDERAPAFDAVEPEEDPAEADDLRRFEPTPPGEPAMPSEPEPQIVTPAPERPERPELPADATLAQLTDRLDAALESYRARRASGERPEPQPDEPAQAPAADPRSGLRSALDKLARVSREA